MKRGTAALTVVEQVTIAYMLALATTPVTVTPTSGDTGYNGLEGSDGTGVPRVAVTIYDNDRNAGGVVDTD